MTTTPLQPPTPPTLVEALAAMDPLELYSPPDTLLGDVSFARRSRLAECFTAAHLTAECCRRSNHVTRVVGGIMLSIPWSQPHYWCEVCIDGTWCGLDPLMIAALKQFGSLDPESWPSHRFMPTLARFPSNPFPLVSVRSSGARVSTTLLTSVAETPIAVGAGDD